MKVFIASYSVSYLPAAGNVESNKPIHLQAPSVYQVPITLQRHIIFILTFVNQKNCFRELNQAFGIGAGNIWK